MNNFIGNVLCIVLFPVGVSLAVIVLCAVLVSMVVVEVIG